MNVDEKGGSRVAVVQAGEVRIDSVADAMDLLADASHTQQCDKLLIPKECMDEAFFDLKTGLLGEMLQKYTNYYMRVAFVGDFSKYESKSLRDFIRESNKGKQVNFLPDTEQALVALHR
ncbi:DUF4180 domain-containing protein [Christensenellaceae bacterium OttesenSCG-928-K19]|nr:DUF4180 domain-containing protein [Christensenellaceae bacterium OttesenSCG-928-K19]